MRLNLVTDNAIGENATREADGLGFSTYAAVLAEVARDTRGPFTIGVFGDWGSGKTSLMRLIEKDLSADPAIVSVWFNAWRYEKDEHPVIPLVGTIIQAVDARRPLGAKLSDSARAIVRALRAIAYGFSIKGKIKVPGFAELETAVVAKDVIDRDERLTPDPIIERSLYYGAFTALDSIDVSKDLKIVVFIDDLDRCLPDQAIKLLESIKLVLSQPGFIFVIGVARKVIEGYLHNRYAKEFGVTNFRGSTYLDKIVQLPFHIPPGTDRMNEFCTTLLADQEQPINDQLSSILPIIGGALGGNPRAMVRFINNVLIDTAISARTSTANPVETMYFAVSRCIQQRWPDILEALYRRQSVADAVANWDAPTSDALMAAATENSPEGQVAAQVVADPELALILLSEPGKQWLRNEGKRHASIDFLMSTERVVLDDPGSIGLRCEIFVSCMPGDRTGALDLVKALAPDGHRTRMDEGPGTSPTSRRALEQAWLILVCFGQEQWPEFQVRELEAVTKGKLVLPVLLPSATVEVPNADIFGQGGPDFSEGVEGAELANLRDYIQQHRPAVALNS